MYPIPSERKLSVVEISKHWSREIEPPASAQELRDGLGVWAAGSAVFMPALAPLIPDYIDTVTIYAHDDDAFRSARPWGVVPGHRSDPPVVSLFH
jgi:hypothetical protein